MRSWPRRQAWQLPGPPGLARPGADLVGPASGDRPSRVTCSLMAAVVRDGRSVRVQWSASRGRPTRCADHGSRLLCGRRRLRGRRRSSESPRSSVCLRRRRPRSRRPSAASPGDLRAAGPASPCMPYGLRPRLRHSSCMFYAIPHKLPTGSSFGVASSPLSGRVVAWPLGPPTRPRSPPAATAVRTRRTPASSTRLSRPPTPGPWPEIKSALMTSKPVDDGKPIRAGVEVRPPAQVPRVRTSSRT